MADHSMPSGMPSGRPSSVRPRRFREGNSDTSRGAKMGVSYRVSSAQHDCPAQKSCRHVSSSRILFPEDRWTLQQLLDINDARREDTVIFTVDRHRGFHGANQFESAILGIRDYLTQEMSRTDSPLPNIIYMPAYYKQPLQTVTNRNE